MITDCENDTSFDSIPSMASERSTRISTMRWPYSFNPKLFDKTGCHESPIKDEIEKKIKSSRRKFESNYVFLQKCKTQQDVEFSLELDRSDPFLQPSLTYDLRPNPTKKKIKGLKHSEEMPFDRSRNNTSFPETNESISNNETSEIKKKKLSVLDLPLQRRDLNYQKENKFVSSQKKGKNNILISHSVEKDDELNRLSFFTSPIQEENVTTLKYSPIKSIAYKLGMNSHSKCMEASQESMVHFDRAQIDSVDKDQRGSKYTQKSTESKFDDLLIMNSENSPDRGFGSNVDLPSSSTSRKQRLNPMTSIENPGMTQVLSHDNISKKHQNTEQNSFDFRELESFKINPKKIENSVQESEDNFHSSSIQLKKNNSPNYFEFGDEYCNDSGEKKFMSPEKNTIINLAYPPHCERNQFENELKEFIQLETEADKLLDGEPQQEFTNMDFNSARTNKFQTPLPELSESISKDQICKEPDVNEEEQNNIQVPKKLINELHNVAKNCPSLELDVPNEKIVDYITPTNNNKISLSNFKSDSQRSAIWMNQMQTASSKFVSTSRANKILNDREINTSCELRNSSGFYKLDLGKEAMKEKESFILHDANGEKNMRTHEILDIEALLSPQGVPYSYSDRKNCIRKETNNYEEFNQIREDDNDDSDNESLLFQKNQNKTQIDDSRYQSSYSKHTNQMKKPPMLPKLKLIDVTSVLKTEAILLNENKTSKSKKNELHYDPSFGNVQSNSKNSFSFSNQNKLSSKPVTNNFLKDSKVRSNKENKNKANMPRSNASVQNLMNSKRTVNVHTSSFNSSISGSSSKASFKENSNSFNVRNIKKDKVNNPKLVKNERDISLSKQKPIVDIRVQPKYPYEEKYTII